MFIITDDNVKLKLSKMNVKNILMKKEKWRLKRKQEMYNFNFKNNTTMFEKRDVQNNGDVN